MTEPREPPERVRVVKLQEAHVDALVLLELATTAMYHAIGFDAAEVPARHMSEIARMPRDHDVYVAEADDVVAGYVAWRDEAPGVAYVEELGVSPEYHRLGIGSTLLEHVFERARAVGMTHVVLRAWERASWAQAFYRRHGFVPLADDAPSRVLDWRAQKADARPLTRPGEVVLWREL